MVVALGSMHSDGGGGAFTQTAAAVPHAQTVAARMLRRALGDADAKRTPPPPAVTRAVIASK